MLKVSSVGLHVFSVSVTRDLEESYNFFVSWFLNFGVNKYVHIPQNIAPRKQNGVMINSGCMYLGKRKVEIESRVIVI